ncbi:MAG TPA: hypothetical protein VN914_06085 [Polyangia bacterium]|nr:hypothetical protein [Polyangia bacterium]
MAKQLKRIDQSMSREGGIPHQVVRDRWLADMAIELRKMARSYERTGRGAKELLEGLVIAEAEGLDPVLLASIRRGLADKARKRRAA